LKIWTFNNRVKRALIKQQIIIKWQDVEEKEEEKDIITQGLQSLDITDIGPTINPLYRYQTKK
jgi:hypothetical protein